MKLNSILIIDDSSVDLKTVSLACSGLDCLVETTQDPLEALEMYKTSSHTVVLADYQMEPIDGIELVRRIKELDPYAACFIMSGKADARLVSFMTEMEMPTIINKPIRPSHLTEQLRFALHKQRGVIEQMSEVAFSNRMDQCIALLGHSYAICQVRKKVFELSNVHRPVFIEGPFGVGKPDLVRFMHRKGPVPQSRLVQCPCDKMTAEEIEAKIISIDGEWGSCVREASGGTLVLDHVESIPMPLQKVLAKHVSAIADHCRLITWANAMMDDLLDSGKIDPKLYFELTLDTIHLPALSERPVDIEEIVRFIVASPEDFGVRRKLKPTEVDLLVAELRKSPLKGNLRELIQRIKVASY